MWAILPVKKPDNAKIRLAGILRDNERIRLSRLMFVDVLSVLESCPVIHGVTVISSDNTLDRYSASDKSHFIVTQDDRGYCEDAMQAVAGLAENCGGSLIILPSDVPTVAPAELEYLDSVHHEGICVCPASEDGGTNAFLSTVPLPVPLLFGPDSHNRYITEAGKLNVPARSVDIAGLRRDIDREQDLHWLRRQTSGKRAWEYVKSLQLAG